MEKFERIIKPTLQQRLEERREGRAGLNSQVEICCDVCNKVRLVLFKATQKPGFTGRCPSCVPKLEVSPERARLIVYFRKLLGDEWKLFQQKRRQRRKRWQR